MKQNANCTALRFNRALITLAAAIGLAATAQADQTRNNTANNLNSGTAWVSGTVPGAGDIALWDASSTLDNTLGAALTWGGLNTSAASGVVAIGGANNLVLANSTLANTAFNVGANNFTFYSTGNFNIGGGTFAGSSTVTISGGTGTKNWSTAGTGSSGISSVTFTGTLVLGGGSGAPETLAPPWLALGTAGCTQTGSFALDTGTTGSHGDFILTHAWTSGSGLTLNSLSGYGSIRCDWSPSGSIGTTERYLTVNQAGNTTFGGGIYCDRDANNRRNVTITKQGTGTLTFIGRLGSGRAINPASLNFDIQGGTWEMGNGTENPSAHFNVGYWDAASTFTIGVAGTLQFNSAGTAQLGEYTWDRAITTSMGADGVIKIVSSGVDGSGHTKGTVKFTGDNNAFDGVIDIAGGRLTVGNANALGAASVVKVASGAQLFLGTAGTYANPTEVAGTGIVENAGQLGAVRFANGAVLSGAMTLKDNTQFTAYSLGDTGTISGSIGENGGSFGITKIGAGTLTLSGANNYTGATTVTGGRLNIGSTNASAIAVSNGVIGGEGSTTGSLTLTGSSIAIAGGETVTGLTVNGVTFNDSTGVVFDSPLTAGYVYEVLTYGAAGVTNPENLKIGARGTLTNDTTNFRITFTAGGVGDRTWNAITGVWDNQTTANFIEGDQLFAEGDTVYFYELGAASEVTLDGSLLPAAVTVESTSDFVFTGTGSISGACALTKNGTAALTINNANSYTGGTTLNDGTLRVGNEGALGTGTVTLNGGALSSDSTTARALANNLSVAGAVTLGDATNNGVLTLSGTVGLGGDNRQITTASDVVLSSIVSNGGITKAGAGTLTLAGNNTYTGGTTIEAGTVVLGNGFGTGKSGTYGGQMTIKDGVFDTNGQTNYRNPNQAGSPYTWLTTATVTLGGLDGATPQIADTAVTRMGIAFAAGTAIVYDATNNPGTATVSAQWSQVGSSNAATRVVNVGDSSATEVELDFAGGMGDLAAWDGRQATIQKTGAGTMRISSANNFPRLQVTEGTLVVNHAAALGASRVADGGLSNIVTVDGGILDLNGISSVADELVITSGSIAGAGTLTVSTFNLNGTVYTSGTFDSSNSDGFITGTGIVQVGSTGFAGWITGTFANGTVPSGQQGPNDDPDGDGIDNLVEYAIDGLDPTVPNASAGTLVGNTLTFAKRQPLATDIAYAIEESTDLGAADAWTPVTADVDNDTTISYTLPGGLSKDFMRLKVTQP